MFILERRPFSKQTLTDFNTKKSTTSQKVSNSPATFNRLIASPNLTSKFSPSMLISKSPSMLSKRFSLDQSDSQSILNKFSKNKPVENSKNVLLKYSINPVETKILEEIKELNIEDNKNIPVNRKNRNVLKNIEDLPTNKVNIINTNKEELADFGLPLSGARKQNIKEDMEE